MPVVAVGFAVALDIGAGAALAAGTLTTLAAVTAIGATVGAIGAVTHDKTLSLIGMGLGIVGAVGTLASGAGVFDNVSDLFNSSSAAGPGGASIFDTPGVYDAASGGAGVAGATSDLADTGALWTGTTADLPGAINATSALAPAEGDAAAIETAGQPGGALSQSLTPAAAPDAATAGSTVTGGAESAAAGASTDIAPAFDTSGVQASLGSMQNMPDALSAMKTTPSGLLAWANKNPLVSFGLIQAGGSFISGLTNPMTPAQIDALNAQADVNRATAGLIQRETANQNQPIPTASVTGKAEPTTGLINSKPVGSALITGKPNTGAPPTSLMGTTP